MIFVRYRYACLVLLVFCATANWHNLKEADVRFYSDHMELFIESSKTDQYRDGSVAVIARTGTGCCPVAMLKRYMIIANISMDQLLDKYLFRRLVNTKNVHRLRDSANLSYTRARELVLDML